MLVSLYRELQLALSMLDVQDLDLGVARRTRRPTSPPLRALDSLLQVYAWRGGLHEAVAMPNTKQLPW